MYQTYKIIRIYLRGKHATIAAGLTLKEAQRHCRNPETNSETCKLRENVERTRARGAWFESFDVA